jgi:hypothetical protein
LIFNFSRLSKIAKHLIIIFLVCGYFYGGFSQNLPIHAQTAAKDFNLPKAHTFSKQVDHFLDCLIKATKEECFRIFGKYNNIVSGELGFQKLYFVSYDAVEPLLDQAVNESIDSLTLFTLPRLQNQKNFAIVFNEKLLERIQKNYDFHALFNISVPSLEGSSVVKMKFLAIGQGKLIVGYSRNAKIKHPDYNFATGKYDYRELFIMDAKKDSKGNLGLFNIKGLSHPDGKPQWMKGPLNVDIQSLIIHSDSKGQKKILIQYNLFGIKEKLIDPISIEKLNTEAE